MEEAAGWNNDGGSRRKLDDQFEVPKDDVPAEFVVKISTTMNRTAAAIVITCVSMKPSRNIGAHVKGACRKYRVIEVRRQIVMVAIKATQLSGVVMIYLGKVVCELA